MLASLVPMIILPYYCVIGGWVSKYFVTFISGGAKTSAADGYFSNFISLPTAPLFWFALYLGITALVVLLGVEKGIEKVSKWMMPVLIILSIGISVYSLCLPGALEGLKYYVVPDFSRLSLTGVVAAMGQLFYSMSLAMGIMITYGSYMKKDVNVESSVHQIEIFDTSVAFLAGLMIIPAVFVFSGGDEAALGAGPGLMFITLPKVFDSMFGGSVLGAFFFALVLLAALTSSISLMETVVSIFQDRFNISRKKSCLAVLLISIMLGIPSSLGNGLWQAIKPLGMDILSFFDFISNSIMMPIVSILTCIFIGYIIKPKSLIEEAEAAGGFKSKKLFVVMIKYFAPVCIMLILVSAVLEAVGLLKI